MLKRNKHLYKFGDFSLDLNERLLFRNNEPVRLSPKAFELLLALVSRNGQVVEKNELMQELWADAFVEEANLAVHISILRKILGNDYIETIPKRGYRFNAGVREIFGENLSETEPAPVGFSAEAVSFQTEDKEFDISPNIRPINAVKEDLQNYSAWETTPKPNVKLPDEQPAKANGQFKVAIAAVLILAVLSGVAFVLYKGFGWRSSFQTMKITRIVDTGKTVGIAISPDGKYLAHAITDAGTQSLWVKHISTNSSVQLVPPADFSYGNLTFSNDGSYIYYVQYLRDGLNGTLYRIPMLGGEAKKIFTDVASSISFAPDGEQFTFIRNLSPSETALMIGNINGNEGRQLAVRRKPEYFNTAGPSWSPDGKTIACAVGIASGERTMNIAAFSVESGEERMISTRKWRVIDRVAWLSDESGLLAPAMEYREIEATQICFFPFPDGEPRLITNDLNNYNDISLTVDSKTLVTVQFELRSNIWLLPKGETSEAKNLTQGVPDIYRFIAWTPDKKIIYASSTGGTRDIWIMDFDGGNRKQLTSGASNDLQPIVTPDGRYVVFASNRAPSGFYNIWRMNIDGSNPVQLTNGSGENQPTSTPDGQWVVYMSGGPDSGAEQRTIWKVSINGGEPVQLVQNPSNWANVSPGGSMIVCWYKQDKSAPWKIALVPIAGGQPIKIFDVTPSSPLRWLPDGSAITFVKTQNGVSNIWSQPINDDPPKQLTNFTTEQIQNFDWSSDNQLICSRGITARNAVLISDFK